MKTTRERFIYDIHQFFVQSSNTLKYIIFNSNLLYIFYLTTNFIVVVGR